MYLGWMELLPTCIILHFSRWSPFPALLSTPPACIGIFAGPQGHWCPLSQGHISWHLLICSWQLSCRPLSIKIKKACGPRTDPSGTPERTSCHVKHSPLRTVLCVNPSAFSHLWIYPRTCMTLTTYAMSPYFLQQPPVGYLVKRLLKSRYGIPHIILRC